MATATNAPGASEVEKTLRAFDDDPLLEVNPSLTGRIMAGARGRPARRRRMPPPGVIPYYAVMALILAVNVVTAVYVLRWNGAGSLEQRLVARLVGEFGMDRSSNIF